jgi:Uncharacterized protein conserved in bacteria
MRKFLTSTLLLAGVAVSVTDAQAQIAKGTDYTNKTSATIGTYKGVSFREAGFSGLYAIPGTNGKEFWTCSDRGVNVDCANANPAGCKPTYDKLFCFPSYAPKLHRVKVQGDSIQIIQTLTVKRPGGSNAVGYLLPTGFGSTATEEASTDTVQDCANFTLSTKRAPKDAWSIDAEAIALDQQGNFWLAEENGPSIWKLNKNGVAINRYSPYANLPGAQAQDILIDTCFKYRKNNRGFENMTIAPNGKIYAIIQSPLLYPTKAIGEATGVHRMIEIDPATNTQRMFVYLNDGVIGTGSNQIRLQDWKLGDMTAINDSTFLVLEAAARGTTDIKRMYMININQATVVNSGLYNGQTLEALVDSTTLAGVNVKAVKKTLVMDLLANSWDAMLDKAEGITIINDSTIAICNDNDYAQTCPLADGIPVPTTNQSHIVIYNLKGANKLQNYVQQAPALLQGLTGPSSSKDPYQRGTKPGVTFTSLLTAGDGIGGYRMCGLPDGLGAYDNGNGTFTVLMNHEIGNGGGIARAHGQAGTFVSKWVFNKSDLSVVSGADLMQRVNLWNPVTSSYTTYTSTFPATAAAMGRFCSGDLAPVSAYYNSATGKGTQERIYLNGEETGSEGRVMAHIATGPNAGNSYEVPALGKASWENYVASPLRSDTTVMIGMDDATPGQVYVYVGTKTNSGTEVEKAGMTNGRLYGVTVTGMLNESSSSLPAANTAFALTSLGDVRNTTGSAIDAASNTAGITRFLRPEDGGWDPSSPNDFYFVTTNAFNSPSRLWRLRFSNAANPVQGGTITAVLDGTEGQQMLDNIGLNSYGQIILQEDVGGNVHNGKTWMYDIATDQLAQIAHHDSTRFISGGANYLTQDEEASGAIDVQEILGPGKFLVADQAHYGISGELVEGGQLQLMFNPDSYNASPEINVQGNTITINSGDVTPSATDNTDFGNVKKGVLVTKTFTIQNNAPGALKINGINMTGAFAGEYALVSPQVFPVTVAANGTQNIVISFMPQSVGLHGAAVNIRSNDFDEKTYTYNVQGTGVTPEINVQGNSISITDGDVTAGAANHTDFGSVNVGGTQTRSFNIQNNGSGELVVSNVTFAGANAGEYTLVSAPVFPATIATSGALALTVQFAPTAVGMRNATISIMNDDTDEGTYDFALQGMGTDPASVTSPDASSLINLYPNPSSDKATLAMTLRKDEQVVISVIDMQGRQVMKSITKNFKAGLQTVDINTSQLQAGFYFVKIAAGAASTNVKMAVIH